MAARTLVRRPAPRAREKPSRGRRSLNPAGRGQTPRRGCLALRRWLAQRERERERERRVSDADASNYGLIDATPTLKHVIPQRNHANKQLPLKNCDPVPLPRALHHRLDVDHRGQPKTRPYVTPTTHGWVHGTPANIHDPWQLVNPLFIKIVVNPRTTVLLETRPPR